MFFEVKTQLTNHVLMVVPAAAIGVVCGLCAILFTIINLKAGMGWAGLGGDRPCGRLQRAACRRCRRHARIAHPATF